MVRYNQTIKNRCTDSYCLSEMGGLNMKKEYSQKIYVGKHDLTIGDSNEKQLNHLILLMVQLSLVIDEKSNEFIEFSQKYEDLRGRAEWLKDWNESTKKYTISKILTMLVRSKLQEDKSQKLENRIKKYVRYFDVLEKESNEKNKYVNIFNYLTQIPAQINTFIKKNVDNGNYEVKPNMLYDEKPQLASSSEDANFYAIGA